MKETLSSSCFNKIKDLILTGALLPAERIKGDYLKTYLGVGLSPIREALSRMVNTGLIELVDNVGFRVAAISKENLLDFYRSYAKIELLLFKESIDNGNSDWETAIVSRLYQLSKVENSGSKVEYGLWSSLNEKFHEALISGCSLNELKKIRDNYSLRKTWYHNLAYSQVKNELLSVNHKEHSKIAELALARNFELASILLHKHTMQGFDNVVLRLTKYGYVTEN